MDGYHWEKFAETYDDRRDAVIPGNKEETIRFSVEHFIRTAEDSIKEKGSFFVALSGGSTPKAIFEKLASKEYKGKIDWPKVSLFWSDERQVAPDHPDSNYKMAMDAGFKNLPIPKSQIHRMETEGDIEENALKYETLITALVPKSSFDLVMLGMGEDGHTASLFPKTHGLHSDGRLVIANFIPQHEAWRMSLTFKCINHAKNIAVYIIGKSKAAILEKVLSSPFDPDCLPIQNVGTTTNKALIIADSDALTDIYLT